MSYISDICLYPPQDWWKRVNETSNFLHTLRRDRKFHFSHCAWYLDSWKTFQQLCLCEQCSPSNIEEPTTVAAKYHSVLQICPPPAFLGQTLAEVFLSRVQAPHPPEEDLSRSRNTEIIIIYLSHSAVNR